jgi:hypothetical protein
MKVNDEVCLINIKLNLNAFLFILDEELLKTIRERNANKQLNDTTSASVNKSHLLVVPV